MQMEQQRQEQARKAQMLQMFQQDMERKTEANTVQQFSGVQTPAPVFPVQKGQRIWSVDSSGNPSYKQKDVEIVEPKTLDEINAQKVKRGEMSLEEGYRLKNKGQPNGLTKPPPGYRFTSDGASLEAIPGGPADAKLKKESSKLDTTLELYETAREGLLSGLEGSTTGPVSGRIPAVTANQQIAEGAVAAMAPVLKQLFRASGEGVFTDRDQALLLEMIPKRTDHPKAIKEKIANIDSIVRAKLGAAAPNSSGANTSGTVRVSNGKETFEIPVADLEEAKKDGFGVVQ